jgi:hypothetical protein
VINVPKIKRQPKGKRGSRRERNLPAAPHQAKRDKAMYAAYRRGKSRHDLAEKYGLSVHTVGRILWEQGGATKS